MTDNNPLKILYDNLDPWMHQMPHYTRDELFAGVLVNLKDSRAFFDHEDGLFLYFVPENKWLSKVHFYSNNHSYKSVKNLRAIITRFFNNTTFEKLVGITPLGGFVKASERTGIGQIEGILTQSHMTEEGKLIDQYIFGINRKDYVQEQACCNSTGNNRVLLTHDIPESIN